MQTSGVQAIWTAVVDELRLRFGATSTVDRWLGMVKVLGEDDKAVELGVASRFVLEWLEKKYLRDLEDVLGSMLHRSVTVRLRVDPGLFQELRRDQERILGTVRNEPDRRAPVEAARGGSSGGKAGATDPGTRLPQGGRSADDVAFGTAKPRRLHDLESLVVGDCNRTAYSSLRHAVEDGEDGEGVYNPLLIFGATGVGKTHLLEGGHAEIKGRREGVRSRYVTGERFLNAFVMSLKDGTISRFREGFRTLDVLVFDDFQLLLNKKKTLEEFRHTFDTLLNSGSRVIIATTQHPRCMTGLDPALTSRLLSGLLVTVSRPDYTTRLEILRRHASRLSTDLPDEILARIAEKVRGNTRELIGALNQVSVHMHVAAMTGARSTIDIHRLNDMIEEVFREDVRRIHAGRIAEVVGEYYRLSADTLISRRRDRTAARARHVAIYLCRRYTRASLSEIGSFFGKRNSSTIRSSELTIRGLVERGDAVRKEIEEIRDVLESGTDS